MEVKIRLASDADWAAMREIYVEGLATGDATFETAAPNWERWDAGHLPFARLVAQLGDGVVGWAALSPVSARSVYAGVAEVSVYVASSYRGKNVGKALLKRLVDEAEHNGIWTLQSSVFPENEASIAIHKRCGFREVGFRERISKLHGKWRTTILLERRSQSVGCE